MPDDKIPPAGKVDKKDQNFAVNENPGANENLPLNWEEDMPEQNPSQTLTGSEITDGEDG